jgi:tetratricopeptide (TPR) repeat protein
MSITPLRQDGVLFASDMPPEVDAILQEAVVLYDDTERAESMLWQAHEMAPERLEIYIALYKFYFYKNLLDRAEEVAHEALAKAARQCGCSADWTLLTPESAQWTPAGESERFYLYTLKALAFIALRRSEDDRAAAILKKLIELDPEDQVGGSVIRDLMLGTQAA